MEYNVGGGANSSEHLEDGDGFSPRNLGEIYGVVYTRRFYRTLKVLKKNKIALEFKCSVLTYEGC